MKNKRRLIGNILIITGLILLLGAGGLFFYNMLENNTFDDTSRSLTDEVKAVIGTFTEQETEQGTGQAGNSAEPRLQQQQTEFVPQLIGDGVFDGILAIPSIDLEMSVYDTWNDEYLKSSICRYYGSPYTDDFVIAGHNYRSGFGKLKDLELGDEVFFTDMNGVVTRYVVSQIDILDGTDISGMLSGGWALSLYTCTYGGSARLTVRCNKV